MNRGELIVPGASDELGVAPVRSAGLTSWDERSQIGIERTAAVPYQQCFGNVEPTTGIEPVTYALRERRSTD